MNGDFVANPNSNSPITLNGSTLNVGGNLKINTNANGSGNLAGTTNIVLNGTGTWSDGSGSAITNNLAINTAGTITISGNVYYSAGTLTYTAGTVTTTGSTLHLGASTALPSGITWNNLTISNAGTYTLAANTTLTGSLVADANSNSNIILNNDNLYIGGGLTIGNGNGAGGLSGTTNLILNGTGTWSQVSGSVANNLTINTAGTITVSGTVGYNTGTLTYTAGTVTTTGSTLNIGAATTLDTNGMSWNNVNFTGGNGVTYTLGNNLTLGGTLSVTTGNGTTTLNGFTIYDGGSLTTPANVGKITGTTAIVLDGTGTWSQGNQPTGGYTNSITINTPGTITISGSVGSGPLTYVAGTVVTTGSTLYYNTTGNLPNGIVWNNLSLNGSGSNPTYTLLGNLTLNGTLSVSTNNSTATLNGYTIDVGGGLTSPANVGKITGATAIVLDGTGTWSQANGTDGFDNAITINTAGTITISGTVYHNTGTLTVADGTLNLNGNNFTPTGTFVIGSGGTLELWGSETITAPTLNAGSTVLFTGSGGSATSYTLTNYFGGNYQNLVIDSTNGATDTFKLGGTLTVAGNLTNTAGTLDVTASNYGITVGGNWANSGTFSPRSGTVTLDGASPTISGTDNFYNLTVDSAGSLTLPAITANSILAEATGASSDITLNGTLSASGTGNAITLVSGRNFINDAGSGALSTPSGDWLIYSTNPSNNTLDGITGSYNRYSCTYGGSCPSLGTGNGLLYSYTPMLTVTPTGGINITYGTAPNLSGYSYTLSGYLGSDGSSDSVTGSLNGSTNYTQGSNVGSYAINYASGSLTSSMGYGFSYASNSTGISVGQRSLTITASDQTKTYGFGSLGTTGFSITSGSLYGTDAISGVTLSTTDGTSTSGNYKVTGSPATITASAAVFSSGSSGNYNLTYDNAATGLTVNPATLTITGFAVAGKTYDGTTSATITSNGSLSGLVAGDSVNLNTGSAAATFGSKNAGTETATASGYALSSGNGNSDANNYTLTQPTATATIAQKALTITANSQSDTYGDTLGTLTYTNSGLATGDSFSGALTTAHGGAGTVLTHANGFDVSGSPFAITQGTLTINDGNGGNNYSISYNSANLTLTAKALTDSGFAVAGRTYDGLTDATITSNGALTGGGSTSGDGKYITGDTVSLVSTGASATFGSKNAGTETATASGYTLSGAQAGDYTLTQPTATATIAQKALTITANSQSDTYGDTLGTLTYTNSGLATGDSFSGALSTAHGGAGTALANANGFNVSGSPFTITQGTLTVSDGNGGNNYAITYNSANLTLAAKAITVTADNESKVFGDSDPALDYTESGLAAGDASASFTGALTRDAGESIGNYTILQGTLAATGNYRIGTFNDGIFAITGTSSAPIAIPTTVQGVINRNIQATAPQVPLPSAPSLDVDSSALTPAEMTFSPGNPKRWWKRISVTFGQ